MSKIINRYTFSDITVNYILNNHNRAVMILLPESKAEEFYEKVSPIIKHGNSYIYRTDACSFYSPTGTQAVVRYSENGENALVVCHSFKDAKELIIELKDNYVLSESLYNSECAIDKNILKLNMSADFSGNVYLFRKK